MCSLAVEKTEVFAAEQCGTGLAYTVAPLASVTSEPAKLAGGGAVTIKHRGQTMLKGRISTSFLIRA